MQPWGTHTIEPIAQVIVRPDETNIGKLPNEDSQSLVFDDTNLFKIDKFAGWDRIEGGGRANVGFKTTTQFNRGGSITTVFGQSYQLFGVNSFANSDYTNTGLNSGLDTARSDYVARLSYQPDRIYAFNTRFRFDHDTFELQQFEAEARASFDRWSVSMLYGRYDPQPAARLPDAARGHPRHSLSQAEPELARHRLGALRHRRQLPGRHRVWHRLHR